MPENFSDFSVTTRDENSFPFTCVAKTQALVSEKILLFFVINIKIVRLILISICNKFYLIGVCKSVCIEYIFP